MPDPEIAGSEERPRFDARQSARICPDTVVPRIKASLGPNEAALILLKRLKIAGSLCAAFGKIIAE
jgi:hypothetical protein